MSEETHYASNVRRGRRFLLIILMLLLGASLLWTVSLMRNPTAAAGNADVPLQPSGTPSQTALNLTQSPPITHRSWFTTWSATPRAGYRIDARVLRTRRYYLDLYAHFSPVDFALAWGPMGNPEVDAWVTWDQHDRWYYYRVPEEAPFDLREIRDHSANVHIIPANPALESALRNVEAGDVIRLEGYLVDVEVNVLGFQFETTTSLSREDSGAGACEVLLVEKLILDGAVYR